MVKSTLVTELYKAFRPYVEEKMLSSYDNSFLGKKIIDEKFICDLLRKYIDLNNCSRNLKKNHDILIINYALIELPSVGLQYTKLFKDYLKKEKVSLRKGV